MAEDDLKVEVEKYLEEVEDDGFPWDNTGGEVGDNGERCLCWRRTGGKTDDNRAGSSIPLLPGSEGSEYLNRQLWNIFVIRHLLEYPLGKVVGLMRKTGGVSSPADWFSLCDICRETVEKAGDIYRKLLKLESKFKSVQEEFRQRIRKSCDVLEVEDYDGAEACKEIRDYFKDDEIHSSRSDPSEENLNFAVIDHDVEDFTEDSVNEPFISCESVSSDSITTIVEPATSSTFGGRINRNAKMPLWRKLEQGRRTALQRKAKLRNLRKIQTQPTDPKVSTTKIEEDSDSSSEDNPISVQYDDNDYMPDDNEDSGAKRKQTVHNRKAKPDKVPQFTCTVCLSKRQFTHRSALARHMRVHSMSQHPCSKCNYPCKTELELVKHLENNKCTPNYQHKCEHCNFESERLCNLLQHNAAKHPLEATSVERKGTAKVKKGKRKKTIFTCDVCGLKFGLQKKFDYHMKLHQYFDNCEEIDGKLKCKLCGELTVGHRDLKRHTREIHAAEVGIPVFQCSMCVKTFTRQDSMEHHIAIAHTEQSRFNCDQCKFRAMKKSQLIVHQQSHRSDTDKPYICDLCAAPFKSEKVLRYHMKKTHSSSRNKNDFRCKYCTVDHVVFLNKSLLNRHIKDVHKDLYIHKCDQCDNSYLSVPSLQLHKKINHGSEAAECQFCQTKVLNSFYLYQHYQRACRKKPPGFKYTLAS